MLEVVFARLDALDARLGADDAPLVVMPFIDAAAARRSATQLARRSGCSGLLLAVEDGPRAGFIAVANAAFRRSRAPHFAYVAQDAFAGRDWLATASAVMPAGGGLVAMHDGKWHGALAAFGVADAGWARGNYDGDLFFAGYRRHYADVELTLLAMAQQRLRHDPAAVLIEVDWDKESASVDAADRLLFRQRSAGGFDGRVPDKRLCALFS